MALTSAERLQELIKLLRVRSVSAFAASIGVRSTVLANMLGGRMSKPSFDTLEKIKTQYPAVNLEWLVTGQGEPLLTQPTTYTPGLATELLLSEPPIRQLGRPTGEAVLPVTLEQCQQQLAECRKELATWKEKADMYKQLADDRQTIIELMKKNK